MKNYVYIATSLDGFIADANNQLDWLPSPAEDNATDDAFGFSLFMDKIDAIVMGRNTFQTVLSFEGAWPYKKPLFVLSSTLNAIPTHLQDKVTLVNRTPKELTQELHTKGYKNLYIDGGKTIHSFLENDLIDEMTITTVPTLLGGGIPLFRSLQKRVTFQCTETQLINGLVQSHYIKIT